MEKINIAEMRKETLIFDTRPVTMQRKRKRIMGRPRMSALTNDRADECGDVCDDV